MKDVLLIFLLLCIAAAIVFYLIREKKRGVQCVGCPYARECAKTHAAKRKHEASSAPCSCHQTNKTH